jgi:hypothetical protein
MPVTSMARIAAEKAVTPSREAPGRPTGNELLKTIGAYVPTDVTAFYVPIAAGMVAAEAADGTKHAVGIGVAVLAMFATWVVAHRTAVAAATAAGKDKPTSGATLRAGGYEILVAGLAMYIWALAMPGSWVDFGKSELWAPAAIVGVASFIFGGIATLRS